MTKKKYKGKKRIRRVIKGNNIKQMLSEAGKSQQWLADTCEMTKKHVSELVNGKVLSVSLPIAARVAGALRKPIHEVFDV